MQAASFLTSSCKYDSGSVSIVLLQYGVFDVEFSYHGVSTVLLQYSVMWSSHIMVYFYGGLWVSIV